MTGRRRADRKAPGAALAFALAIALLPTGQAQENTTRGLETADEDPGVHSKTSSRGSQSALQTCELGSENIKVPIFEEDTPSVMEIEMEELDKWMNSMNKNADCECLPTLKEEKESNHNPRYPRFGGNTEACQFCPRPSNNTTLEVQRTIRGLGISF
ncbi:transmembrane protein 154 isoform X5 [Mustela putorius furo]|uniref:Transmembrane protein 154 isoform X5 n=1 Tax=Mustela putorius furo TaxID=9669 RepID=A0A8U0V1L6_MUSPF|nr:transmembrane protein 154 isoform X5 [Mustela putorius furo]